jgi:hypothetical protein
VAPELDTGALLAQTEVSLDPGASVLAATALLFDRGARLLLDRLTDVLDETAGQPQPPGGSYDSWPGPDAVRQFRRSGNCLLRLADLRLFKQDAWRGPA